MKKLALLLCCFALVFITVQARADLDPSIGIGDPDCHSYGGTYTPESSNHFSITSVNGGGFFAFCNADPNELSWHTVDIVVHTSTFVTFESVTCEVTSNGEGDLPFINPCTKTDLGNGYLDLFFTNPGTCSGDACGIPFNHIMFVDLGPGGCTPGTTDCNAWPDGVVFTLAPGAEQGGALNFVAVPEPASLSLLAGGLLALAGLRRRKH